MDKLRELFGEEALTFAQLEEKLKDNKEIKLANLASGEYVAKKKHDETVADLAAAQGAITSLKDTVAKFDGVDVEELKKKAIDLEKKYNDDMAAVRLDSAVNLALVEAKAKNSKLAKAALDMSLIKLDGENLLGLSEQLDKLKESDAYLFDIEEAPPASRVSTGTNHQTSGNADAFMSALMQGAGLSTEN